MRLRPLIRPLALLAAITVAIAAWGFVLQPVPSWPEGSVQLRLELGNAPTYSDGTNPNTTAVEAVMTWNRLMSRLQFLFTNAGQGDAGPGNAVNELSFSDSIYGYQFGDGVLAVALISSDENRRTEADVLVNRRLTWDSYRGPLRYAIDLRRVLVHELGHVLGLGHPTGPGESPSSIMNPYVGDREAPTSDDLDGIAALYGRGPNNPAVPLAIDERFPADQAWQEGQTARFDVLVNQGSTPITYQWRKDGTDILGATQRIYERTNLVLSDAGRYSVILRNETGSVTSREAILAVNPAMKPFFHGSDMLIELSVGTVETLSPTVSGTRPMRFQWRKDGIDIPGATGERFGVGPAKDTDAGIYTLAATNASGTTIGPAFNVMVVPIQPPEQARVFMSYSMFGAETDQVYSSVFNRQLYEFQWYRDGVLLPGATSDKYYVPLGSDPAVYHVTIANSRGATSSLGASYVPRRRQNSSGGNAWIATARTAGAVYFLFENPARLERYDLAGDTWLPPIALTGSPRTIVAGESEMYIGFDDSISVLDLDTNNERRLLTVDSPVLDLLLADGVLYAHAPTPSEYGLQTRFLALHLSDSAVVETRMPWLFNPTPGSLCVSRTSRWLFGKDRSSSGALIRAEIGPTVGEGTSSFPRANNSLLTRTFVSVDGRYVFDDGGTVFRSADLGYVASFGRRFEDIALLQDGSYVTVGFGELIRYDSQFRETGRQQVPSGCRGVAVLGGTVVVFAPPAAAGGSMFSTRIPLEDFVARSPAARLDPILACYSPAKVLQDEQGVIHLLARSERNIFRWSPSAGCYLESWPLTGIANDFSYSPTAGKFLVAYADGRLTVLNTSGEEATIRTMAYPVEEIVAMGERMLLRDDYGADVFTLAGQLVTPARRNHAGNGFLFDGVYRRVFLVDEIATVAPNSRILNEDGSLGPISSARNRLNRQIKGLRLRRDGDKLGTLGGEIMGADTLVLDFALPYGVGDMTWLDRTLFTARDTLNGVLVERWDERSHSVDASARFSGRLVRLLETPAEKLVLITISEDGPAFVTLDANLKGAEPSAITTTIQPSGGAVDHQGALALSVEAESGARIRWSKDGVSVPNLETRTCLLSGFEPPMAGLYAVSLGMPAVSGITDPVIVGVRSREKVTGAGREIAADVLHPNGNRYDQVLLTGRAAAVTAEPGQITRTSFIDGNGDIVQIEFSGRGTLSIAMADTSGPRPPILYRQPTVSYMAGRPGLLIVDADETTNITVFSVGRATAFDRTGSFDFLRLISSTNDPRNNRSPLFDGHEYTIYDGLADIAYLAILSSDGRFGGVRAANARFSSTVGFTGIYAPGVQFTGPVYLGDLQAHDSARPLLELGGGEDVRITGGSLSQPNGRPVSIGGISRLKFTNGTTAHGVLLPAKRNRGRFQQDGVDITEQIVVNP